MEIEGAVRDEYDEVAEAWGRELPAVAPLPLELSKRLARLAALVDEATVAELARLGLTKAEYEVLAKLRAVGAPYRRRPSEMSQSLSLSSGGTTNVVHRLVAAGLVVREPDPEDRRSTAVRLTAGGVRKAEEAVLAANVAQRDLWARLGDEEARGFADHLRSVLGAVQRRG